MSIFQRLYDSEINFGTACFFDSGFDAWIGDEMNGIKTEISGLATITDVEEWLTQAAILHYPGSTFAKDCAPPADKPLVSQNTPKMEDTGFSISCSPCSKWERGDDTDYKMKASPAAMETKGDK